MACQWGGSELDRWLFLTFRSILENYYFSLREYNFSVDYHISF